MLPGAARGTYFIHRHGAGLIAEVCKPQGRPLRIALAPGTYQVRKLASDHYLVRELEVVAADETTLDEVGMVRRPLVLAARKGDDERASAGDLRVSYHLSSGYLRQADTARGSRPAICGPSDRCTWVR